MSEASAAAAPQAGEGGPGRIRELIERAQFAAAEAAARVALAAAPDNRDLLYMLAVSERCQQRFAEALVTLEQLEQLYPEYPRLFQERGHCYVALRSAEPAIEAFERAVLMNPALPASWRTLETLYRMTGRRAKAAHAAAELAKLASLPPALVTAFSMFADGELEAAERLVRGYLLEHGDHIEGMRLLAQIGVKHQILDDAEILLAAVLEREAEYHAARYEYATVLYGRHKHLQAREQMEKLLKTDPDNRVYRTMYATVWTGLGDYERALPLYRQVLGETPRDPDLHLSIAHALKTLGRQAEAIESYRAAGALRPGYGDVWWSLANLKTYRFTDGELEQMRAAVAAPRVRTVDRYHLCFALGKALEDRGAYAESFAWYERGNALKKAECRYRPGITERNTRLQQAVCTAEFFGTRGGFGCASRAPIFIVGLPRSGSTLIEQILASHPEVEGTLELANVPRLAAELEGRDTEGREPRYPQILAELGAQQFRRFGEQYLADTRAYRSGRKPRFIDKMPNNFRHLGLIHLMLPEAVIIDARREPMACCFGNFKQLFATGQEFSYSFEDLARYYRSYVELMAHWGSVLPGRILKVQYEELIEDFEPQVRRLLEFAGLSFEPACLTFYQTARSVRTASSEQVRQPLNREGIDQWRHFEPWLGPLREALGELAPPTESPGTA